MTKLYYLKASGQVLPSDTYIYSVTLTAGEDPAHVRVRAAGPGGPILTELKASANSTATANFSQAFAHGGVYVEFVSGTDASVTVELG